MTDQKTVTDHLFFDQTELNKQKITTLLENGLKTADDGELFFEYNQTESLSWDDGKLKSANFDTEFGFGLRAIAGDSFGYAHSSEMSEDAIKRALNSVSAVYQNHQGHYNVQQKVIPHKLYTDANPITLIPFEDKVKLLAEIDRYARAKDNRVVQVSASLAGQWQAVKIIRADGSEASDLRPLVRLNVSVVVSQDGKMESGYDGGGGRILFNDLFETAYWQARVDEALRQALINLEAIPAPAGELPVVLGSGWPGVLLHEAVGHGLEGDFNRKGTSTFSGRIGETVASKGVTVIDDGTIPNRRGSITIDDEGTASQRNILIEDGKLVGYLQDRMNARLMGVKPTGNGRRESYADHPMPRMTNTFMLKGAHDRQDMIRSVNRGIYAVNFGGGQVDITSGKFVFSASEAYLIENGEITSPIKGATLIGNGPDIMSKIAMIGHDLELDSGIGICGKDGQSVPVGVGQPSLLISAMTVGGTES